MDHFPLPTGVELKDEELVSYIASTDYIGVPFLEYPKKQEAYEVPENINDAYFAALYPPKLEQSEFEQFLQTWLVFGLLQEVLGKRYGEKDFLREKDSKWIVSTRLLREKLEDWICDEEVDIKAIEHINSCLHTTHLVLITVPEGLFTNLCLAICAVGEAIECSMLIACNLRNISNTKFIIRHSWTKGFDLERVANEMQKHRNWCAAHAHSTLNKFYSFYGLFYVSHILKPPNKAHVECTFEKCRALLDVCLHRDPCSGCPTIESNQEDVVKALKQDKNALIDVQLDSDTGEITLAVVPAEADSTYVALSHVWSDGLGNPTMNAVPQCQLRWIYDLLSSLCVEEPPPAQQGWLHSLFGRFFVSNPGRVRQKRPYLWLDTLCCPVDPTDKIMALKVMPEVYRKATNVLVLDSSLAQTNSQQLQPIEIVSRLFTSGWMYRLWTLNEANLAEKLWIRFQDKNVLLGEIFGGLSIMSDPITYNFTSELASELGRLKISSRQRLEALWLIVDAIRLRSVTEPSDEPICLGLVLGLCIPEISGDTAVTLSASQDDRMKVRDARMARFWEQVAKSDIPIPASLIYHVGAKLKIPGMGWAPSTLLDASDSSAFMCNVDTKLGLFSKDGLSLSSVAISISVPKRVDGILSRPNAISSATYDLLKVDDDSWINISSTYNQKLQPPGCEDKGLYDLLAEAEEDTVFELLFEGPVSLLRDSRKNTRCLLVAQIGQQSQTNEPQTRKTVRFIRQGEAQFCDANVSKFLNHLLNLNKLLQEDSISKEVVQMSQHGAQDPRYIDAYKPLVQKAWSLVYEVEKELDEAGTHFADSRMGLNHERQKAIFALSSRFYRNRYLMGEQEFPETQQYCIN